MIDENIDEFSEELASRFEHYRFTADPGQTLVRIDKFLTDKISNASRTKIQAAADATICTCTCVTIGIERRHV